ncbi:hypothetical protein AHM17_003087 [Salmonella enterica subsp. enterica serovar Sandiego]|nr:hypothetical protein [Salmonella enterica subsp. enterica serovar Sandiego]
MDIFLYSGRSLSGRIKLCLLALGQAWCAFRVGVIGIHIDDETITHDMHELFDDDNPRKAGVFKKIDV